MGAGLEMICRTCRTAYNIGYGSYSYRPPGDTLAEFEKHASDLAAREPGRRYWASDAYRKFLSEHEGHDFLSWSEDFGCCSPERHGGDLLDMGAYGSCGEVRVAGYSQYGHVDLSKD